MPRENGSINPFRVPTKTNVFTGCPFRIKMTADIAINKMIMGFCKLLREG
jgi:hypothetical protein